jgi:hypothetical protein
MKFKVILALAFILASHICIAGNEIGNGDDNIGVGHKAAWFLGDKPVYYCYETSHDFGLSSTQIEAYVEKVVKKWKNYVVSKGIHSKLTQYRPSFDYIALQECDSSEDIKFYLGTSDKDVENDKKVFVNPTAFTKKTESDFVNGWGKGYIWVAPPKSIYPNADFPNWSYGYTFEGIITHEIGHVLGIADHVDGTIMENLTHWLQVAATSPKRAEAVLTSIDDRKELVLCKDCAVKYEGTITSYNTPEKEKTFQLLMGRKSQGQIKASYEIQNSSGYLSHIYSLGDDRSQRNFEISWIPKAYSETVNANTIFYSVLGKTVEHSGKVKLMGYNYSTSSEARLGNINVSEGTSFQVIVERNSQTMGNVPLHIKYIHKNEAKDLFSPILNGMN